MTTDIKEIIRDYILSSLDRTIDPPSTHNTKEGEGIFAISVNLKDYWFLIFHDYIATNYLGGRYYDYTDPTCFDDLDHDITKICEEL